MKTLHYTQLGGTLFVPATHKNVHAMACGEKYPELKSMVIDFEDGLDADALDDGMMVLRTLLEESKDFVPFVFVRPRDVKHLATIMACERIEKIEGFVLPKFSLQNADEYLHSFDTNDFVFMPSIEGEELFSFEKLETLKTLLLPYKEKIVLIRFGAEDMLRALGLRRTCHDSLFDFAATRSVLGHVIGTFKSAGFALSGGVYPCFKEHELFITEVRRDIKEGLSSKTLIHPNQIATCHELYRVSEEAFDEALEILLSSHVLFAQNGKMAEVHTMSRWAQEIVYRAQIYGLC